MNGALQTCISAGWHRLYWLRQRQMELVLVVTFFFFFFGDFHSSERSVCPFILPLRTLFLLSGPRSADPSCLRAEAGFHPEQVAVYRRAAHAKTNKFSHSHSHSHSHLRAAESFLICPARRHCFRFLSSSLSQIF